MNVLQINKYFASSVGEEPRVGGVEKVVQQLSEGLVKHKICTRVLASHHTFHPWNSKKRQGQLEIWRAGTLGFIFNTPISPSFPLAYRTQVQWADVIHFHVPSPLAELSHLVFSAPKHAKVVVTFHADPGRTRLSYLTPLYRPILRRLLHRADQIVATAPANSKVKVLSKYDDKCKVIPLAANLKNTSISQKKKNEIKKEVGIGKSKVIIYVGRLVYYKGLGYLIEAMKKVNAKLVIVGKGDERRRLEEKVEKMELSDRIYFAGYVSDENLPAYYSLADLFVLPSVSPAEAFGIVQVEAMSYGVPVINTDLPTGVPFVSKHDKTGLTVPPRSSQELSKAINKILKNDAKRSSLAKNARKRSEKFTEKKMVEKYIETYKQ